MDSALDAILKDFRRRLIEREASSIKEVLSAYAVIARDLKRQLKELEKAFEEMAAAGETIRPGNIFKIRRIRTLLNQIEGEFGKLGSRVEKITEREQKKAISEAVAESENIFLASGITMRSGISRRALETAVGMLGDGSPIHDYFQKQMTERVAETLRAELIKASALGTSFHTIARRLEKTAEIARQRAMMIVRTEVNRVRRETSREIYKKTRLVEAWEWLAVKSSKTCILCLAMDGQIFELEKPFPQHINCRCRMIPVIRGQKPMMRLLGAEWFDRQDDETKEALLGPEAFAEWQRSRKEKGRNLELRDFVTEKFDKRFGWSVSRRRLIQAIEVKDSGSGFDWISRPGEKRRFRTINNKDENAQRLAVKINGISSVVMEGFGETEFDAISQKYIAETTHSTAAVRKPGNYLKNEKREKIRTTLSAALKTGRTAVFEFTAGQPHDDVVSFILKNAEKLEAAVLILPGGEFYVP